ncbi:hypothetical protein NW762_002201 [Fusarium torreyae]|uniref:Uncharacterized protein n=1 Tax=Fusarium torreyae TaxID=1237075 RepID=A0A9W8VPL7_9HYPO|nr:hypothetical protein NW762_002201 [Fusarium torreyae]
MSTDNVPGDQASAAQPKTTLKRTIEQVEDATADGPNGKKAPPTNAWDNFKLSEGMKNRNRNKRLRRAALFGPVNKSGPQPSWANALAEYKGETLPPETAKIVNKALSHPLLRNSKVGQKAKGQSTITPQIQVQPPTPVSQGQPIASQTQNQLAMPHAQVQHAIAQPQVQPVAPPSQGHPSLAHVQGQFISQSQGHPAAADRLVGGVSLQNALLAPAAALPHQEVERRFALIDYELASQQAKAPILPPSTLAQQPPKEFVGATYRIPAGVNHPRLKAIIDEKNKRILEKGKQVDLERNNLAAKGTRNRRDESLTKFRRLVNDKEVELNWWRLKAIALGADPREWDVVPGSIKQTMTDDMDRKVRKADDLSAQTAKKRKSSQHSARNSENSRLLKEDVARKEQEVREILATLEAEDAAAAGASAPAPPTITTASDIIGTDAATADATDAAQDVDAEGDAVAEAESNVGAEADATAAADAVVSLDDDDVGNVGDATNVGSFVGQGANGFMYASADDDVFQLPQPGQSQMTDFQSSLFQARGFPPAGYTSVFQNNELRFDSLQNNTLQNKEYQSDQLQNTGFHTTNLQSNQTRGDQTQTTDLQSSEHPLGDIRINDYLNINNFRANDLPNNANNFHDNIFSNNNYHTAEFQPTEMQVKDFEANDFHAHTLHLEPGKFDQTDPPSNSSVYPDLGENTYGSYMGFMGHE